MALKLLEMHGFEELILIVLLPSNYCLPIIYSDEKLISIDF